MGTFISIDVPAGTLTEARSINATGTITGNYSKLGRGFGFVRDSQGNITSFDPGFFPGANSINNEGAITGSVRLAMLPSPLFGFVRNPDGTIHLLDPADAMPEPGSNLQLPCTALNARSINNQGIVAGECTTPGISVYGFLFDP